MKLRGALVAALIMIGSLVLAFPPAFATAATMNHECKGAIVSSASGVVTCTVDTKYDLLAVAVQAQDGTLNTQTQVHVSTVTDNHGNKFGQRSQTQHSIGANCLSGNCFDSEIWSATALGTFPYSDVITVTLDHALTGGSEGFIEAFDVTGADNTTVGTGGQFCESSCGTGNTAVPPITFNTGAAYFALAGIFNDCTGPGLAGSGCLATTGYTQSCYPTNPEGCAEWSVTVASPATFPFGNAYGQPWYETAVVFGPLAFATETAITKCLFTQIQCWWYPLLFYGVFGGAFMVVGRAGSVDPRGLTYLLLAALTFCSLIQVQMNMTNIMLPVILSITGIAYAVRGR